MLEFVPDLPTPQDLLSRDLGRLDRREQNGLSLRNRFVERKDWVTGWEAEARVADRSLPFELTKIIGRMPEPLEPTRATYNDALKYWRESAYAVYTLDQAVRNPNEKVPIPERIRTSFEIRSVLARFSLYHFQLDNAKWHPRMRNRQQDVANRRNDAVLLGTTQGLVLASDERLMYLWFLAQASEGSRHEFWHDQLIRVQDNPWVRQVQASMRAKPRHSSDVAKVA